MFDWDSKINYLIYFRNASNRNAGKQNAEESIIRAECDMIEYMLNTG